MLPFETFLCSIVSLVCLRKLLYAHDVTWYTLKTYFYFKSIQCQQEAQHNVSVVLMFGVSERRKCPNVKCRHLFCVRPLNITYFHSPNAVTHIQNPAHWYSHQWWYVHQHAGLNFLTWKKEQGPTVYILRGSDDKYKSNELLSTLNERLDFIFVPFWSFGYPKPSKHKYWLDFCYLWLLHVEKRGLCDCKVKGSVCQSQECTFVHLTDFPIDSCWKNGYQIWVFDKFIMGHDEFCRHFTVSHVLLDCVAVCVVLRGRCMWSF